MKRPGLLRTWSLAGAFLFVGLATSASQFLAGRWVLACCELIAFAAVGAVLSPLVFPRSTPAAEAERLAAADGRPIIYWRPGCSFCLRLRRKLGRRGRDAHWVNIWSDPAAAATVRALTGGDETVPTVVVGNDHRVNPDPRWVREQLG
ncbi:glutaredoxin domain-containing protein [Kribbella sp. NPDC051770]|uniref:glutaredoxin domain-containing protein n=1 Tax=Kribbella sp. NPDC051770 TaxID=3155413 RepID=UPI0034246E1B